MEKNTEPDWDKIANEYDKASSNKTSEKKQNDELVEDFLEGKILLEKLYYPTKIRLATDIINGQLNFGFDLVVELKDEKYLTHCYISADKKKFVATDFNLRLKNLKLDIASASRTIDRNVRWDVEDIAKFLNETTRCKDEQLLSDLVAQLKKYISLKKKGSSQTETECKYLLVSLWIIGTYFQAIWKSFGYFSVSAEKRAGKSKLFKVLSLLCFNAKKTSSLTTASISRSIHEFQPTLLIDEAEQSINDPKKYELRDILNGGYNEDGVSQKCIANGRDYEIRNFSIFCPKAIVTYKGMGSVTEDRSFHLVLQRIKGDITKRKIDAKNLIWQLLKNRLYRFALNYWKEINEIYLHEPFSEIGPTYTSREEEIWQPLLSIAKHFNVDKKLIPFIQTTIGVKHQKDLMTSKPLTVVMALRDIALRRYRDGDTNDVYAVIQILRQTKNYYPDDFPRWLNNIYVGQVLSNTFGLEKIGKIRDGTSQSYTYQVSTAAIDELSATYDISKRTIAEQIDAENVQSPKVKSDKPDGSLDKAFENANKQNEL